MVTISVHGTARSSAPGGIMFGLGARLAVTPVGVGNTLESGVDVLAAPEPRGLPARSTLSLMTHTWRYNVLKE